MGANPCRLAPRQLLGTSPTWRGVPSHGGGDALSDRDPRGFPCSRGHLGWRGPHSDLSTKYANTCTPIDVCMFTTGHRCVHTHVSRGMYPHMYTHTDGCHQCSVEI